MVFSSFLCVLMHVDRLQIQTAGGQQSLCNAKAAESSHSWFVPVNALTVTGGC